MVSNAVIASECPMAPGNTNAIVAILKRQMRLESNFTSFVVLVVHFIFKYNQTMISQRVFFKTKCPWIALQFQTVLPFLKIFLNLLSRNYLQSLQHILQKIQGWQINHIILLTHQIVVDSNYYWYKYKKKNYRMCVVA